MVCTYFFVSKEISPILEKKMDSLDLILLNKIINQGMKDEDEEFSDFIQVGEEEYDSDKTYDVIDTKSFKEVLQKPINPPYKNYLK
jgi:hypothetical protein